MLIHEEKKHAVKVYHETSSLTKVRRSFRKRPGYHAKNLPSLSTLRYVVNNFRVFGGIQDRRKGRRSSIEEAEVRKVTTVYESSQLLSLRTASRKTGLSRQKVSTILRQKILKKAYKAKIRMALTERQRKTRIECCKTLLERKRILSKVWFSDESWFYSDGIAQKKNQYYWAFNKDAVTPLESQLTPIKVMVWAAVSSQGVVGPYFFIKMGHISRLIKKHMVIVYRGLSRG